MTDDYKTSMSKHRKNMSGDFKDFVVDDTNIPLVNRVHKSYTNDFLDEEKGGEKHGLIEQGMREKLIIRGDLLKRRRKFVDVQVLMALIGILFMLVENELYLQECITKLSATSIILKSVVSVSTIILLFAVVMYYMTEIKLRLTDNELDDWRLLVTFPNVNYKVFLEILICAIHPLPINVTFPISGPDGRTDHVSSDGVLSILMMLRVYLLGRVAVVHDTLLSGSATRSLSALNGVLIDALFVFKALMASNPGSVLIFIMISILLINSWAMRNCETFYQFERDNTNFSNSMWIVSITFLTVGYGDTYPVSVCGRCVSVATGLMGIGTTALLITVILKKLEQTRAEKYVYSFVRKAQLDKGRKNAAADVIKNWLLLCNLRKHSDVIDRSKIHVHRKLQHAIRTMQDSRKTRESIGESTVGLIEVSKAITDVEHRTEMLQKSVTELKHGLIHLQATTTDLHFKLNNIYRVLMKSNKA